VSPATTAIGVTTAIPMMPTDGECAELSHAESRLWFVDRFGGSGTRYTLQRAVRLRGALDVPALSEAVDTLVARHEALRTRYDERGGVPIRVVDPPAHVPLHIESVPAADAAALEAVLQAARELPFDLRTGPLLRMTLVRLGDADHVLARTVHHIVFDAWSDGIFNRELAELYAAARETRRPSLPPLELQYRDYAAWERGANASRIEADLPYWIEHLGGAPVVAFPGGRPATSVALPPPHVSRDLPEDVCHALRGLSRSCGVTLYATMLAVYALVLTHVSGQPEVVVGTPVALRPDRRLEGLIGLFVNTIALRIRPAAGSAVRTFVRDVGRIVLTGASRNHVPFDRVVAALHPARAGNTPRVHQVGFTIQNAPRGGSRFADLAALSFEAVTRPVEARDFLELHVRDDGAIARCAWLYRTDVLDRASVVRIADDYETALRAFVSAPAARLEDVVALLAGRHTAVPVAAAPRQALTAETVPRLFERQAAKTPDRIAVVHEDTSWSYACLNQCANQLARWLLDQGVGPESLVGIAVGRSPRLPLAMLAVLKAGAAYVPIDTAYPLDRIERMLRDAAPLGVIVDAGGDAALAAGCRVWPLSSNRTRAPWLDYEAANLDDDERRAPLQGRHAAYVIYTSGSSGAPKGVVGLHRGLANRLEWFASAHPFESRGPVLAKTSISFIDGSTELLGPLVAGGTVVMAETPATATPDSLIDRIRRHGVAQLTAVPTLLDALLDANRPGDMETCELWLSSGESLPARLVARLRTELPRSTICNLYGVSEASGDSTLAVCGAGDVTIGRPIWNTDIRLVDENLVDVPAGEPGEICIAGAGLARGYLHDPELTAGRFVPDPNGAPGARMYRTGDRGCWTADGALRYLGRLDRQVKVHGIRLELAEVEAQLARVESVRDAAVIAVDAGEGPMVVAYVVPAPGRVVDARVLRRQLLTALPAAAIPSRVIAVSALPRLANGKLDRLALPTTPPPDPADQSAKSPTDQERVLCGIFAELFSRAEITPDDDFFELGGHSLQATKLASVISERFGVMVPVQRIFESSRVDELAAHIAGLVAAEASTGGKECR
jgi:amino acid adenylation domain-containing protein